ncbi:hypothetical protein Van01_27830 [Micromonospora andamanensis]|uniref:Membrane protein involved in the export of O-antigen and teichoic acid n=2 Tax=Micromonospora andamanensis TaxID=1287068 RepID=A0ABQ4HV83_9ACTN|nr:hypothetical protein Van01_27830 [Micromonospora andamanensis]
MFEIRPGKGKRGPLFSDVGEADIRPPARVVPSPGPKLRAHTLMASIAPLVSGVLNAAMLALSARRGETDEIAAYTVMTAALIVVSMLIAGGTSLLYTAGNEQERSAVRSLRVLIAVPVLLVFAGGATGFYSAQGYLSTALAVAAIWMISNNLSELQFADLTRQLRFVAMSLAIILSRLAALVILLAGAPLTVALALGSVLQLAACEILVCRSPDARPPLWQNLSWRAGVSALGSNRQLLGYSAAEAASARSGSLVLSLVATPQVVGCYGAVIAVYQAFTSVLYGGLRVPMAVRVRRRHQLATDNASPRESEILIMILAVVAACAGVVLAPWIANDLLRLPIAAAALWLQLLALALPLLTLRWAVCLFLISDTNYRAAARLAVVTAGVLGIGLVAQLPGLSPGGATAAMLGAEATGVLVIGIAVAANRWFRSRRRVDTDRPTRGGGSASRRRTPRAQTEAEADVPAAETGSGIRRASATSEL